MKRNNTFHLITVSSITLIALLISGNTCLLAHGVMSKELGNGKILFTFDDGSPLVNGYVHVFDNTGTEIAAEQTDAEGIFDFSMYENVEKISVSDVHGHHRTHVIGEHGHDHSANHTHDHGHAHTHDHPHADDAAVDSGKTTKILIVTAILLAVAAVFYCARGKK